MKIWTLTFISQIAGKGDYIAVFGGEIDPCYKGNERSGGYSNKLILINEASLEIITAESPENEDINLQLKRGWSAGCALTEGNKNQLAVFGGLAGNDDDPKWLNDLWICKISAQN